MSGQRSRRKGAAFERAVARMLRERGVEAKRGLQSRGGGAEQADVMSALPYHFECKAGKRPNVWAAYQQACNDAQEGCTPCVIMHRDQAKPGEGATELLVLPLSVGLDLLVEHTRMRKTLECIATNYDHEHHSLGMVTREHCDGVWQCRACTAEYGLGEEAQG